TNYQYDDAGRIKRLAEINSRNEIFNVQRFEYDDQDNLLLFTDSLGNRTSYQYAGFNKVVKRTDALGFTREFKYDAEERLKEIINERGESYFFKYDSIYRLIEETGFDRAKKFYKYNPAGDLIYQRDALDREIFYQYDSARRVIKVLKSDSAVINYAYDNRGNITKAETPNSLVTLEYDSTGQVICERQNDRTIRFEYDAEGNRTARILEQSGETPSRVEYAYDTDGELAAVKIGGREINYSRDRAGRLINRQMPNGLREQFDYDINGRIGSQKITVGGGRELIKRGYEWDALGNIAGVNDSLRGGRRYALDAVERLKKVERVIAEDSFGGKPEKRTLQGGIPVEKRIWQADDRSGDFGQTREIEEFQYDGDGNLLERRSTVRGSRNFNYGAGDRLSQQEKVQYIYDAVGNLIQKRSADGAIVSYEYDVDNQLTAVSSETGGKVLFQYDAFGRRTAKISDKGTTAFLWDGNVLLSEYKDSQLVTEYIHEEYVPLAKIKGSNIEIYHTDYLGTPKEVTDQKGEIVWQGTYDEFGRITAQKAATEQNIRFQGQYEDVETGLFYNRFRYYDADGCRYINQDPLGLVGDYNAYDYCQSPTTGIDPLGLTNWGYYLEHTLGVPKPKKGTMYRPHAHHIVFKKGRASQEADLKISRAILKKNGIDYLKGKENLIWAPNKNHSDAAAKKVRQALQRAEATKGTRAQKRAAVKKALRRMGKKFADDTIC
ncbi:MAG TPA: RHS repeat-associated core domain-containing protein, partial [Pyrinomonadaceae bacterium]|nr:RHS repeat-associated core domain-containing protein [Pyrinomonadaceae bacterium]